MMWPHQETPWVLLPPTPAFQYYVVEYFCDLGVNELSTLKSEQLVWGVCPEIWLAHKNSQLLVFSKNRRGRPTWRGDSMQQKGRGKLFVSPGL